MILILLLEETNINFPITDFIMTYEYESTIFLHALLTFGISIPNHVVDVNTVNLFKTRLDRFWANQDVKYDFTADLTGTGDRSVYEVCDT